MKKILVVIIMVLACFFGLIGLFALLFKIFFSQPLVIVGNNENNKVAVEENNTVLEEEKKWQRVNVIILGHGGGVHAGGGLADTLILMQIFPEKEKINLISLPRDLWIKMPFSAQKDKETDFYSKINATLAIGNSGQQYQWRDEKYKGKNGGGELAKKVVSEIVGQEIDFYAAVDFAGFIKVVEIIGGKSGLKVAVPYSFVDEYYPIEGEENNPCDYTEEEIATMTSELSGFELEKKFDCRYEKIEFKKGESYLQAEELLKFVRSRHSGVNGGDFGRSLRQQAVIQAIKDKLFSVTILPKLPEIMSKSFQLVKTDLDLEMVKKAIFDWGEVKDFQMETMVIDNKNYLKDSRSYNGQYILIPKLGIDNYDEIKEMVASQSAILME